MAEVRAPAHSAPFLVFMTFFARSASSAVLSLLLGPYAGLPATNAEIARIVDALRRAIRLADLASATPGPHPRTGRIAPHHLHEASMQRQFRDAIRKTDIARPASCHSMRHSFTRS